MTAKETPKSDSAKLSKPIKNMDASEKKAEAVRLRAIRESIAENINLERTKLIAISERIRELEGPLTKKVHPGSAMTIKPAGEV